MGVCERGMMKFRFDEHSEEPCRDLSLFMFSNLPPRFLSSSSVGVFVTDQLKSLTWLSSVIKPREKQWVIPGG